MSKKNNAYKKYLDFKYKKGKLVIQVIKTKFYLFKCVFASVP